MVVKSCAAAEGMTQPELPASPSVSANSTGAALCGARSAETLWTSILARPPRRQSGWIRPEHKNTSLIPPLQTSWFKSTRSLHAHLPPLSTLGCYSFYLRTWRTLQRDPGVLAGSLALGRSWQGMYYKKKKQKTKRLPDSPLWRLEGRVEEVGVFRAIWVALKHMVKAHPPLPLHWLPDTSCVCKRKGAWRELLFLPGQG